MTVAVFGATGKQGGAVARVLLGRGHTVRALTRDVRSGGAKALADLGAELVRCDLDDDGLLRKSMEGADAVYLMTTPFEAGPEQETEQGLRAVRAAVAVDVPWFVFSSVGDADRDTGIPHFESKRRIEEALVETDVPHAILAPVFFRENLVGGAWLNGLQEGRLAMAMPADRPLQTVDLVEIGRFGAKAIENRDAFLGRRIDYASDASSPQEMAGAIGAAAGRDVEAVEVPIGKLREQSMDFALMFEWFTKVGYSADLDALRRDHPDVGWRDFGAWAEAQAWTEVLEQPIKR